VHDGSDENIFIRMKNLLHLIALSGALIWLSGIAFTDLNGKFHWVLVVALIAGLIRFLMEKQDDHKHRTQKLKQAGSLTKTKTLYGVR
jgi:hypothetical protein